MASLKNNSEVYLMVWEVNPSKRNTNNIIGFLLPYGKTATVGDKIVSDNGSYTITDIVSNEPSSRLAHNYITATTQYQ